MATTELTQEEKRAKIAEVCNFDQWVIIKRGLYYRPRGNGYTSCICEAWKLPKEEAKKHEYPHDDKVTIQPCSSPDYFNDLNAMHEAEKTLGPEDVVSYFIELVNATHDPSKRNCAEAWTAHATAAQRAEAFGRALNLW